MENQYLNRSAWPTRGVGNLITDFSFNRSSTEGGLSKRKPYVRW